MPNNVNAFFTKRTFKILLGVQTALVLPLTASLLFDEFNWGVMDFVFAAIWLLLLTASIRLVMLKLEKDTARVIAIGTIVMVLILLWIEAAVGIIS